MLRQVVWKLIYLWPIYSCIDDIHAQIFAKATKYIFTTAYCSRDLNLTTPISTPSGSEALWPQDLHDSRQQQTVREEFQGGSTIDGVPEARGREPNLQPITQWTLLFGQKVLLCDTLQFPMTLRQMRTVVWACLHIHACIHMH